MRRCRRRRRGAKNRRASGDRCRRPLALGATHCGSGCTLGDLIAEWFVVLVPITLFGMQIFGAWVLDYVLAFLFGIAFQYFTIKPMRNLSVRRWAQGRR